MQKHTKQKLELTWIGKGEEPKLEPRILIENPEYSYGETNTGNMLIHGDNLLLDILPDILDEGQKKNKVRNLMYAMHKREKSIENKGTTRNPLWVISLSNSD